MLKTLINAFKNPEIRVKILITLGLLAIYRLGCWLPIPGVNGSVYSDALASGGDSFLGLLSQITGGALANGTVLAIGISPYINASIIIQLLTVAIPALERLSKEGEQGRRKITQITRLSTMILALAQGIGIVISFNNNGAIATSIFVVDIPTWLVCTMVVVILMAGTAFTMWLGERITEAGVGNGISMLIFVGIMATAGLNILALFQTKIFAEVESEIRMAGIWEFLGFMLLTLMIFVLIIYVDGAERRIPITYAKQQKGRKQYGGQSTHIPIKVNASGVLPIIFATAIVTFPQLVCQLFLSEDNGFYIWYSKWLGTGTTTGNPSYVYMIVMALLILGFSYFYAQIQFNPEEVAKNIQQYGGFVQGYRPGQPTCAYLKKISGRITLFGAIFLTFIALVPSLIFRAALGETTLINAFSATGLLIVVSVALEFNKQLESLLMMKQYKGFLK